MPNIFQDIAKKIAETITLDSDKKIQLRDTGNYIQSNSDGKIKIAADGTGTDDITLSGTVTGDDDWVTTGQVTALGNFNSSTAITATGNVDTSASFVTLNPYAATGSAIFAQIAAPTAGRFLVVAHIGTSGTATLSLTAGTFDGTNGSAIFDSQNEAIVLYGISATRFIVVENVGSVELAS